MIRFDKVSAGVLENVIFGGFIVFMAIGCTISSVFRSIGNTAEDSKVSMEASSDVRYEVDVAGSGHVPNGHAFLSSGDEEVETQSLSLREDMGDASLLLPKFPVEINEGLFSSASVRLNKEIYDITQEALDNLRGVDIAGLSESSDKNYIYFLSHVNPLMVLAPLNTEMGGANDTAYTWTPAIYSKVLLENGIMIDSMDFSIDSVNFDLFTMTEGLAKQLMCGSNCSRLDGPELSIGALDGVCSESSGLHVRNQGKSNVNDNDSLGPLQVLRRYLYVNGGIIRYSRYGESVSDLMRWKDNVIYWYCERAPKIQGNAWKSWFADYEIESEYELVVLLAMSHNAGTSIFSRGNSDRSRYSRFQDVGMALKWAKFVTSPERIAVLEAYVDDWYVENVIGHAAGSSFFMPGSDFDTKRGRENLARFFGQAHPCSGDGVHEADCATCEYIVGDACVFTGYVADGQSFSGAHKAVYPIKALVDYMALVRLYTSGNEELAAAFGIGSND